MNFEQYIYIYINKQDDDILNVEEIKALKKVDENYKLKIKIVSLLLIFMFFCLIFIIFVFYSFY